MTHTPSQSESQTSPRDHAEQIGDWYEQSFGELYPIIYRHRDHTSAAREIGQLLAALDLTGRERVLDACCGAGRHLGILREAGYNAWGVDLSEQLLQRAKQEPTLAGRIVRADIRALPFSPSFDVVFNLFTSFGYFLEEKENVQALRQMAGALRASGMLVMDHMNRARIEATLVPESGQRMGAFTVEQRRWIESDRVNKRILVIDAQGRRREFWESVRMYTPEELTAMLHEVGMNVVRLAGNFAGEPFTEGSERMIVIARKA